MGVGDTFLFYNYTSDDGNDYCIKLSALVAAQGGFGSPVDPRTNNSWGYGIKNLRHVYGNNGSGKRTKLPVKTASNSLYVSGGNFTLRGGTYAAEGAIGEKRKFNSIG